MSKKNKIFIALAGFLILTGSLYLGHLIRFSLNEPFSSIEKNAIEGDTLSQYQLARFYRRGMPPVEKDLDKAIFWYTKAADKGDVNSALSLADIYRTAVQPTNREKSVSWYEVAAAQNSYPAQYMLGLAYLEGAGVEKNISKAIEYLRSAAKGKYSPAQYKLATILIQGTETPKNINEALVLLEASAASGHGPSYMALSNLYRFDTDVPKDLVKSMSYLKKSAELGSPEAKFSLGNYYIAGIEAPKDLLKAGELIGEAARSGYQPAQKFLVSKASDCLKGSQPDAEQASSCLIASGGHSADVELVVGLFFDAGQFVTQDKKMAFKFLDRSARSGNPTAQTLLIKAHDIGEGTSQNLTMAYVWALTLEKNLKKNNPTPGSFSSEQIQVIKASLTGRMSKNEIDEALLKFSVLTKGE